MKIIDKLNIALGKYFHTLNGKNYVRLYDTPRIWNMPFSDEIMPRVQARATELVEAAESIFEDVQYRLDLSSLDAPDADWRKVILNAMDVALTKKIGRREKPQIRFLFGQTPDVLTGGAERVVDGSPDFIAFRKELAELVRERGPDWECIPEIWLGRLSRIIGRLADSFQEEDFLKVMSLGQRTEMTWNHTKIMAADGYKALMGGHNLHMDLYRDYPPVHDVSVKVLGDAPLSLQKFLDNLWNSGTDLLTSEYLDTDRNEWVNAAHEQKKPVSPFDRPGVMCQVKKQQKAQLLHRPKDLQYKPCHRILTVGKYWIGPNPETDYLRGSDLMKEFVIKNAKKKIRMSQQDIVSAWKKQWSNHHVCRWLIEALLANPELELEIVVSPLDASAGAYGDQYSFGSGAKRTFDLLRYYLTHDVATDEILPDPGGKRLAAIRRIKVAPFFFTDKVPESLSVEGETYKWPGADKSSYTATLREPPLSEQPPKQGLIGHPLKALLKASGLFYPKVAPAPGNHAKVTIIDDEFYIVGSDNMYPGYHAEINYLIEGGEALREFITSYWEPLWAACSTHAVDYMHDI